MTTLLEEVISEISAPAVNKDAIESTEAFTIPYEVSKSTSNTSRTRDMHRKAWINKKKVAKLANDASKVELRLRNMLVSELGFEAYSDETMEVKAPNPRKIFDLDKFKKAYPDLNYQDYFKETEATWTVNHLITE